MSKLATKPQSKKELAVEILVKNPDITYTELAKRVDVNQATIRAWRSTPAFIDMYYDKYMVEFGFELPAVLNAMIREAKEGNVQAGRLVLEHSGKLVKRVSVKVDSPFEKFLNAQEADIIDVETIDDLDKDIKEVGKSPLEVIENISKEVSTDKLPNRNKANNKPQSRIVKERKKIKKLKSEVRYHEKKTKKKYNSMYKLRLRAKEVGLELLPPGKPSKTKRAEWIAKLEELEANKTEK